MKRLRSNLMNTPVRRSRGFVLIEALVALILVGIGLVAVYTVQQQSLAAAGDGRARTEAANLTQQQAEVLRNMLARGDLTALANGSVQKTGSVATYTIAWAVDTPNGGLDQRRLRLRTTWTDASGAGQVLDLNSLVAWDDPNGQIKGAKGELSFLVPDEVTVVMEDGAIKVDPRDQSKDAAYFLHDWIDLAMLARV